MEKQKIIKQETIDSLAKKYYYDNIEQSNIPEEHYTNEIIELMIGFANYQQPIIEQLKREKEALENQNRVLRNLNFKYREKLGLSNEPMGLDLLTPLD